MSPKGQSGEAALLKVRSVGSDAAPLSHVRQAAGAFVDFGGLQGNSGLR